MALNLSQIVRKICNPLRRRRVPVMLQVTGAECGPACLAMILNYFGRSTRLSECRERCGSGRSGVTARVIAESARSFGLRVKAYTGEPPMLGSLSLPAIVHWKFNHFVVVERWSHSHVEIVDPAAGRRTLNAETFDAAFTGVALTFEPGPSFERRSSAGLSLTAYARRLLSLPGFGRLAAQIVVASLLLQALGLAGPFFTKVLVDDILRPGASALLSVVAAGIAMLVLTQAALVYLRAALLTHLRARADSQLMPELLAHLLSLPYRYFQQRTGGDLISRLESHTVIRETLTSQTLGAMLDLVFVIVYLVILLLLDPVLAALAVAIGCAQLAVLTASSRRMRTVVDRELDVITEWKNHQFEVLNGITTIKAAGGEDRALRHWTGLLHRYLGATTARGRLAAEMEAAMGLLRTASPLVLLWAGALRVLDGSLPLGSMLALNGIASSFLAPLGSILSSTQQLHLARAHLDRLADVLEARPEHPVAVASRQIRLSGGIELRNVSFRYEPHAPPALRDISLRIAPGQKVAIVGPTGSGKSTLALLLLGLYRPEAGQILYDGVPLEELDCRHLRRQYGVVLQDCTLFSGSIHDNIASADPTLTRSQIQQAAKLAAIHDEIVAMPMGYETRITGIDDGLSGGQRQRLALARALVRHPRILLLDEATSHLDGMTERVISENLRSLPCTRIVIAHRLSTVQDADLIAVLDRGAIVEQGTHAELLRTGQLYRLLAQSQRQDHAREANAAHVRTSQKLAALPQR